jgi:hypothetical protein
MTRYLMIVMSKDRTEPTTIHLPTPLKTWLQNQADRDHRSLNNYVVLILGNLKEKEVTPCISAH